MALAADTPPTPKAPQAGGTPPVGGAATQAPYEPAAACFDEAFDDRGTPRGHYGDLLDAFADLDLDAVSDCIARDLEARGVRFGGAGGETPFVVDPVPRVIPAEEWEALDAGIAQRARALNAFVADAYGARRGVDAGVVPNRLIEGSDDHEPDLNGLEPPLGTWAHVIGLDVVRRPDGAFAVLEDNARTPSGLTYVMAAREALQRTLPSRVWPGRLRPVHTGATLLGEMLRMVSPWPDDPSVVLLTDGPRNSAWYEHRTLARRMGVPLVTLKDLFHRGDRLWFRDGAIARPVDVVYRRTDEHRVRDRNGTLTPEAEALLAPWRAGTLGLVNGFGTGIADDKLTHAYVEDMVRFYLDEEPSLPSLRTYDLADGAAREEALDRIEDLVIKPRSGYGGEGVVICAHATPEDRERAVRAVREDPDRFIAQDLVMLSGHPTVCDGRLASRHVDLRPFAFVAGDQARVLPGGLTRVALDPGALVVNSSQHGGGKDTWVLS